MAKKKDLPKISVIERRKQFPFGAPGQQITLKDGQKWALHIINTKMRSGRYHDVVNNKGWVPVLPEELDGTPNDYGFAAKENRLVRGEHGEEILMKMLQADFDEIQNAKARENLKGLRPDKAKYDAATAAAAQFGDQAGDAVYQSKMDIQDSRANVELEESDVAS